MTILSLPTIETGPNREIRFEIDRSQRQSAGRQGSVRVSIRLWASLNELQEKVPTGQGLTLDAARFGAFEQAVHKIAQTLDTSSEVHE